MPHVVLNGVVLLEEVFEQLKPLMIREEQTILRTNELYLEREKAAILIDSLSIETGKKTAFLAMISSREDGLVVRLYPKFEVEKTDGVKKILAEIAKQILEVFPALKVGETNLQGYLK